MSLGVLQKFFNLLELPTYQLDYQWKLGSSASLSHLSHDIEHNYLRKAALTQT